MVQINIDVASVKTFRELLCFAQSAIYAYPTDGYDGRNAKVDALGKVIDQLDVLRPLGPDGKHGDLHTKDCGCDDIPRYSDGRPRPKPATGDFEHVPEGQ